MKEVALDAKNSLSALVQEVEETGEGIVITRHGKPAARLVPVEPSRREAQAAAWRRLREIRAEAERRNPGVEAIPWETLKTWARDEDDDPE